MRRPRSPCPAALLLVLLALQLGPSWSKDWADHWCEINDCKGLKAAEAKDEKVEAHSKEVRIATRRYYATGEIRAIKSEHVKTAFFQYDGPTLDHPAFPGVANEHAERKERNNEEAAISARKEAEKRAAMGADWRPDGGYLPQSHADATALLAVDSEHAAVLVAKERFKHKAEEVRISCQYDIGRKPGTLGPYTTYPRNPNGCAAGSVWLEGRNGELYNDGSNLLHRTNEWEASVWRKTNGTHKSWFEDVYQLPPGHYGPESRRQIEARARMPYKMGAPPPCAPGYGGAGCKREIGAGADYVDEEDTLPPWAGQDVKKISQLKKFWKRQIVEAAAISGSSTEPARIAGGANAQMAKNKKKKESAAAGIAAGGEKVGDGARASTGARGGRAGRGGARGARGKVTGITSGRPARGRERRSGAAGDADDGLDGQVGGAENAGSEQDKHNDKEGGQGGEQENEETEEEKERKSTLPVLTGVERIPWDVSYEGDDATAMEVMGHEEEWEPNPTASAGGPWYGGWWVAVLGKRFGAKPTDLKSIHIGEVRCRREMWLSETSAACMVPRGMGLAQNVAIQVKGGAFDNAVLEGKFSYDPPEVLSYHPHNGAPRGGQMVTVYGRNFGHVDTSPVIFLAGRICLESFWVADHQVMCRAPPGAGGYTHMHNIDVQLQPALHVQDMPRRLKSAARSIKTVLTETIKAKRPDMVVELLTGSADSKSKKKSESESTDLMVKKAEEQALASMSTSISKEERAALLAVVRRKAAWDKRAAGLMQKRAQDAFDQDMERHGMLMQYLDGSAEEDLKKYDIIKEKRARLRREKQEREREMARLREEEEHKIEQRKAQAEEKKKKEDDKVKKNLDKFHAAKMKAAKAKSVKMIKEVLKHFMQAEPSTEADVDMLQTALTGALGAGIAPDDAGVESLKKHLEGVRARLGHVTGQTEAGAAKADGAPQSDVPKDTNASDSRKGAPPSHDADQDSRAQAASAPASPGPAGGAGLGGAVDADDVRGKDTGSSFGDGQKGEAGACAGEGRCSSREADGSAREDSAASAAGALDDDDLPALDLYADDESPGKKKRRRRKKRK